MAREVAYDVIGDCIVIRHEDGREERLTSFQLRQRATWREGRLCVEDVLGMREVPVR